MNNLNNLSALGFVKNNPQNINKGYILLDRFDTDVAAGSVNGTTAEPTGQVRTVTDTNSKISISGGKVSFATGEAAGDGIWYPLQTRIGGKMYIATTSVTSGNGASLGWDVDTSGAPNTGIGFRVSSSLNVLRNATNIVVGTYSTGTDYQICVVMRSTGACYFIKGGTEFPKWTLLFVGDSLNSDGYPMFDANNTTAVFNVDNLRIPSRLWLPSPIISDGFGGTFGITDGLGHAEGIAGGLGSGGAGYAYSNTSTWSTSGGKAINTPTTGAELILNGGFDSDTANWTAGGSATLASTAGGQSGNCLTITNGAASRGYAYQSFATVVGGTYLLSFYIKNGLTTPTIKVGNSADGTDFINLGLTSSGSFGLTNMVFKATATTTYLTLSNTSSVLNDTTLWDTVSVKVETLSELCSLVSSGPANYISDISITQANNTRSGLMLNSDSTSNPQNFILAYIDRSNATGNLIKCVAGTYTSVISGTVTYSAGAILRVIKSGTSYSLYYSNAQVGSTSTISDSSIVNNTLHGLFSTYSGNTLDNFVIYERGGTTNAYGVLDSM